MSSPEAHRSYSLSTLQPYRSPAASRPPPQHSISASASGASPYSRIGPNSSVGPPFGANPSFSAGPSSSTAAYSGTGTDLHRDLSVLSCAPLDPFHLHEHDADVQGLYVAWTAAGCPVPPPYDPGPAAPSPAAAAAHARAPWVTKAAAAWVLARQLGDGGFERYALAQLVQHAGVALFGPWAFIEARCPPASSMRRFADHWVAWNASLGMPAGGSGSSEFTGLFAATLVGRVVRDETHDPRIFELAHWFSACGDDFAAKCNHDPIVRAQREWEKARPPKQKAPVFGRMEELRLQARGSPRRTRRTCWKFKRRIFSSIFFLVVLACTGVLAGLQIGNVLKPQPGTRQANVDFTAGVVLAGLMQLCFVFFSWHRWFHVYCLGFNLCALANGVIWAFNTASCIEVINATHCVQAASSTAFVLLCIPFSIIHWIAIKTSL